VAIIIAMAVTFLLFAYGNFLPNEVDHALIADCEDLGPAASAEGYTLVELNAFAGMLTGGARHVVGRLYRIDHACLAACDKRRDHPNRYHREEILLADGQRAHAYLLHPEQARGRRRVKNGDWQKRFQSGRPEPGAFVSWAKSRHSR
jgi:gamma-glutamylcyclotransferase (GGCT)/AIG2-like uncharacterized protein YtfP